MRYFIDLSYNGANFHGWQIQPNATTVQSVLNDCLSVLLKKDINCVGAGRTDTGVHAKQMIAHFDYDKIFNIDDLVFKLNAFLPKDIAIRSIKKVKCDAHARFDAVKRTYIYKITTFKNVFENDKSFYLKNQLDLELMKRSAKKLIGTKDFSTFRKSSCRAKSPIKTMKLVKIKSKKDKIRNP